MRKSIVSLGLALVAMLNVSATEISFSGTPKPTYEIKGNSNPLCAAISKGDLDTVKKFVEYGADVNEKTKNGLTPLMIAATYNKVEIINYLLSKGADPRVKNDSGFTALKFAESSRSNEAVAVLSSVK